MNRRGLVLSVLAVGAVGFGGAAWYATRPQPVAEAVPVALASKSSGLSVVRSIAARSNLPISV